MDSLDLLLATPFLLILGLIVRDIRRGLRRQSLFATLCDFPLSRERRIEAGGSGADPDGELDLQAIRHLSAELGRLTAEVVARQHLSNRTAGGARR